MLEGLAQSFGAGRIATKTVSRLEGAVEPAEDKATLGLGLSSLIARKPSLDLGPPPKRVPGGVARRRWEGARAALSSDDLVDIWRVRRVRSAISAAHTSSSGSTWRTSRPGTVSTPAIADVTASRSNGASRLKSANVRFPLLEKVASSQPAATSASRRSSVSAPLIVNWN